MRHRLAGDLASHGERLDTARAEEVARRLAAGAEPAFEDFFVDGRVALRRPPLCLEHDGPGPNIASGAASISAA